MKSENPYASPQATLESTLSAEDIRQLDAELANARRITWLPALGMLACSIGSSLVVLTPLVSVTFLGLQGVGIPWIAKHIVEYWHLYLTPFSLYFLACFFGSLSLLNCHHRLLAKIGCFFNLLPLVHPLFPLAIPFAVKGLAAMRNPEVDLAFRRAELDERSSGARALAKLFGPASIFLMLSCLTMACIVLPLLVNVVVYPYHNPEGADAFIKDVKSTVAPRVAIAATLIGYAAIQMLRGRQYWVCVIAVVTSLVPLFTPCVFLGIPIGLWTLVLLLQKETRAAFKEIG